MALHQRIVLLFAVFLFLGMSASAAPARADTVYVSFQVTQNWGTGFIAEISITNNASWIIWDWLLEFDFTHAIGSIWDAEIQYHQGDRYGITAVDEPWEDGDLAPGETATFSFMAASNGTVDPPFNGTLNGWPIVFNGSAPAPPPVTPVKPGPWPERFFAPYVDTVLWPPFDLVGTASNEGIRYYTLAFIVAKLPGSEPSWGGYYTVDSGYLLPEINAIREMGGDVMVSFGGAAGTVLAAACNTVAELKAAYKKVIDAYDLTHIDFDVEGMWVADPVSIERRSQALAELQAEFQAAGRELVVWYTLPVLPDGLTADGVHVVESAVSHGVELAGVNVMAMDYGDNAAPDPDGKMGEYAIQAADSLFFQLKAVYQNAGIPKTDAELWRMVGVTPMIGLNDVTTETFYQEDAEEVLEFADLTEIGMLSFWSANRDNQCPGGKVPYVSPNCSSILQELFEFTHIFLPFTDQSLYGGPCALPADTGGTVHFYLMAGEGNAHRSYLLLGGVTGTAPGIPLPGGQAVLPVNWDPFTNMVLSMLNGPVFVDFMGALDGSGNGTALLNLPALGTGYAGLKMYYAYCLSGPFDFASNPVEIELVP